MTLKRHNAEMFRQQKRTTIYFEPAIHRALRFKSIETERSLSDLVNEAVRLALAEDAEDLAGIPPSGVDAAVAGQTRQFPDRQQGRQLELAAFKERAAEENLSFEAVVQDLKRRGQI